MAGEVDEEVEEEQEEETWWEEKESRIALIFPAHSSQADSQSTPFDFFGASFVFPSCQGLPRSV